MQAAIDYFTEGKQPGFDLDDALQRLRGGDRALPGAGAFLHGDPAAGRARGQRPVRSCRAHACGVVGGAAGASGAADFCAAREPAALSHAGAAGAGFGGYGAHDTAGGPAAQRPGSSDERLAQAYSLLEASADDGG